MSDCNKISDLLTLYCDNEITQQEKILVENHIQSCQKCKQKLDVMLKAKRILENSPAMPVPESMFADFLKNKEIAEKKEKKVVPFYKNYRMYTSIAAIFIFAFVLKSGLTDKDKFMPQEINDSTPAKQTLKASKPEGTVASALNQGITSEPEITDVDVSDAPVTTSDVTEDTGVTPKIRTIEPEVEPPVQVDTSSGISTEPMQKTSLNPTHSEEYTDSQASGGGGRSQAVIFSEINPTARIFIYVSEEYFTQATELFSNGTYLLSQAEQKLTENGIPFESDFANLDESIQYKIVVLLK